MSENFELIAILLVSHGYSGSHLLFKYPFSTKQNLKNSPTQTSKRSQYSLISNEYSSMWIIDKEQKLVVNGVLSGLDDSVLANLCIINKDKLELKIDNVFFLASQPILHVNKVSHNVVFAVKSPLPRPVIRCYQGLSLAIANALLKEDANSSYLNKQSQILNDCLDENQNLTDYKTLNSNFEDALAKSTLAQEFKQIYENIQAEGIVDMSINNCVRLSFCLPHLAYKISEKCEQNYFVEVIFNAIKFLKPYLGFLLLESQDSLLKSLPVCHNYCTRRLIELYNPSYSLARYAAELDVSISEIYSIVNHLIYWAKVKIIYPISESNVYVIHPATQLLIGSHMSEEFSKAFPSNTFQIMLSRFSLSKPLVDHFDPKVPKEKHLLLIDMLLWLLSRNTLMQMHTYIYLLPRKTEHMRLGHDNFNKFAELSFDDENDFVNICSRGIDSENSIDNEISETKDSIARYEEYRELFTKYKVSDKDQQYMFKAFENKSESDLDLFVKLLPYYDGMSNLEAIMYYEKLTRSDLLTFLDKFKDILIASVYEDLNPLLRINVKIN